MGRPDLNVYVAEHDTQDSYELTQSPSTIDLDDKEYLESTTQFNDTTLFEQPDISNSRSQPQEYTPPKPSIPLLYRFCNRRDVTFLVGPAVVTSMLAGGMAPFMTQVIGQAFDGFAAWANSPSSEADRKSELLHTVGLASIELIALAIGQLAFSSIMSSLWIWVGERNVMRLRKKVYDTVTKKSMTWYDLTLGGDSEEGQEKTGAGGLMAKFSRETDDVRNASSLTAGMVIQHLVTLITCMVLAFIRSWALTLVILSTVPLVIVVQGVAQRYGMPIYEREREGTAKAGSILERAVSNIATVKAFNAAPREAAAFNEVVDDVKSNAIKSSAVWGASLGFSQFQSMALFVQAFGFGSKLVRDGRISPGDVMAVFWACLIGATSLQSAVPYLQDFAKGQMSMAALIGFMEQPPPAPSTEETQNSVVFKNSNPFVARRSSLHIRGIRPRVCRGEFVFRDVTFAYPSRPNMPVLRNVNLFLPAHETTFIVGGSGSGKSTISSLLLRHYSPQQGTIEFDNQSYQYVDSDWILKHIACVNQGGGPVFDMSVIENVKMGKAGVTKDDVFKACRVALMHEFVRDLPQSYDTKLGNGGVGLSGGQKQRLAIARAWIRDPEVLVLGKEFFHYYLNGLTKLTSTDEATSALDPTSRVLVFEAIKAWRKNKTTIVITHDLSQITPTDFVYLLKDGEVVEQGYRSDLETVSHSEFSKMAKTQGIMGFPVKDIVEEDGSSAEADAQELEEPTWKATARQPEPVQEEERPPMRRRYSSIDSGAALSIAIPTPAHLAVHDRRSSLQFTPVSPMATKFRRPFDMESIHSAVQDDDEFEADKKAMSNSGRQASRRRVDWTLASGAHTMSIIIRYTLITLAIAAADGILAGLKSVLMECVAVRWMTRMRKAAFSRVLAQDKAWFDDSANNVSKLVDTIIKDADDAKRLISICFGMALVVFAMLGLGLVWSLVQGWQLTLVGVAIVPIFAGAMAIQARMISKHQLKAKRAREDVSKIYYETLVNVRGIRAMSFQDVYAAQFDGALARALRTGVKGAFVEGSSYGLTNAMIYLSEALLFYVGAILIARGTFTYLQMVQVLNLLVFSVSIAAQMMVFVDKISKSAQAADDLQKVLALSTDTQESKGALKPLIGGRVTFKNVSFAYPQRPEAPVLKNVSLEFKEGECVAIVGSSGSGKSTIAALLQRLYEPSEGQVTVGLSKLAETDVTWLREHVSVVSQHPHLFDTTIYENIAYGASKFSPSQVRGAARAANVHDFIMSLPRDYNTHLGENASLISGGQAQRLQIARALVRPSHILLFDECTSALDNANQAAVLETIQRVKEGRTTVLITHKVPVMQMCDRVIVLQDGAVVEQGTYDGLMERRGAFYKLANGGEWE
ncbi:hypothetical protein M422DRAFT_53957 [Sphaerobolus stellatus SS14]|uniref:P-loop containing nucleoside triphosphate hydrolase protein n=1 Tax=Sphaerobolus stellatus (strain SS14) TaxID=990650 RepID=A0A0C9UXX1_SPHS4|nr:hypothetical protein M422DRAFT_53957 [Sphaerobolus stellatus SS14]